MSDADNYRVDRTGWDPGPWDNEPDRLEWRSHGLPCLIVRNDLGNLCGYVAVPPGHPDHGAHYDAPDVEVHGGLTYSSPCSAHGGPICHIPSRETGVVDDVWWLGFDCGHAFDYWPQRAAIRKMVLQTAESKPPEELARIEALYSDDSLLGRRRGLWRDEYRSIEYVRAEVESLAMQLAARAKP